MDGRQQRVYEEAAALWRELFCESPPAQADGAALLDMITRGCEEVSYDRLRSPHLRPGTIAGPGRQADERQRRTA